MPDFKHSGTPATLVEILDRLDDEAGEAEIIGMHFRRHAELDTAAKYETRAEALYHIINTMAASNIKES